MSKATVLAIAKVLRDPKATLEQKVQAASLLGLLRKIKP